MDQKVKKIIGIVFIVLSITAVICIAFGNQELKDAWDAVRRLDPPGEDLRYRQGNLGGDGRCEPG